MIVAFASFNSLGATFMDWSLHWLSGKEKFWNYKKNWIDLVDNPLTNVHAHLHLKNHLGADDEINNFIFLANQIQNLDKGTLLSLYPSVGGELDKNKLYPAEVLKNYDEKVKKLYKTLYENKIKIFFIKQTKIYPFFTERKDKSVDYKNDLIKNTIEKLWIKKDNVKFKTLKKFREYSHFLIPKIITKTEETSPILYEEIKPFCSLTFTDDEWFFKSFETMQKIFSNLKINMVQTRIPHWNEIRKKWLDILKQNMINFYERDSHLIVDAIYQNNRIDLTKFNLDLFKQIFLMYLLFEKYKCRLVLPSDDFPLDTQTLHQFLKY